ncbi:hypothetical protein FQA39_LY12737 [Lamprigera yunnana]|nr:hypothetical protein FQA39_LY12737 [Lamprigera yunnana]
MLTMRTQLRTVNLNDYILILLIVICQILSSEVPRPRGVSLSRASLYDPEKDFMCFDGSLTIPFVQINDDYCDCLDGSDEPGTSACPNGVFYCTNAGHKPLNLHSSRVNDGVCDCCDGSDEYLSSQIKCFNNCYELGQSAREEAQRLAELVKIGSQIRLEFSQKGIQLKQDKKEKLNELHKQQAEADYLMKEKESLKKEAEELETHVLERYKKIEEEERKKREEDELITSRPEAIEAFHKYDVNQDGIVEVSEIQAHSIFDRDRNGEVSEEEAKYFLNEQSNIELEPFIMTSWPRIKPFMMVDAGVFKPPVGDEDSVNQEHVQDEHEEDNEELLEDLNEREQPETEGEDEEEEEEEFPEAKPTTADLLPKYDEETQKIVDAAEEARKEYNSAKDAVNDIQTEIKNIERYMEIDFGTDDEFAILEGSIFEFTDHEYIYKLHPFNKVVQQPKSSSLETHLGSWSTWIGTEENKYSIMHFTNGHSCWNGPQRSAKVRVVCGSENKLTSASEPSKCEYHFDFSTPAACKEPSSESEYDTHDEL